jgi:hypothetical protein
MPDEVINVIIQDSIENIDIIIEEVVEEVNINVNDFSVSKIISTDVGNSAELGTDGGIFVPPLPVGGVTSVFARGGDVVAEAGDYDTSLVTEVADKKYVTDAEKVILASTSGSNTGDQDLSGLEPAFNKNTAFNKNFGAIAGKVVEGNDARMSDDRNPLAHTHPQSDVVGLVTALGDRELLSNKKIDLEANKTSDTFYASCKAVVNWCLTYLQVKLVSGVNIRPINGESLLGSTNLVVGGGARKQTFSLTRDWLTTTLDRVYYINFANNTIEFRPGATLHTIDESLFGRNVGMFIAPYNCKVTKVIITTRNTGSFTGKLGVGSGKVGSAINDAFTNKIVHLDSAIVSAGFFINEYSFPIIGGLTITEGDIISPSLYFSAQAQTNKNGVTIQIEIEEV